VLSPTRLEELRTSLPADTLVNLIETCVAELSDRLELLREAVEQMDHERVHSTAHAMAGMAAGYGMASLEARLRAVKQTACQEPNSLMTSVDDVAAELRRTVEALREALGTELV